MDKRKSDNRTPAPGATGEWHIDPQDAQLHRRRLKEAQRVGPLGRLARLAAALIVLAGAVTAYLNWETLRGMTVGFTGLTSAFNRVTNTAGANSPDGLGEVAVEAPGVVGEALPSSIEDAASPEPTTAAPAPTSPTDAPLVAGATPPRAEPAIEPTPEPPPEPEPVTPETFDFGLTTVTVSEADASAAVLVLRHGGRRAPSAITWWATSGTATAGSDFADLGRQVLRFAASEQNRSIRVPIIGDRNVEGAENFFVHIAAGDDTSQAREELARVEIVIGDDD